MILHILTKAPDSTASEQMQQVVGESDTVVLIEEAVTAALHPEWLAWEGYPSRIFLLTEDVASWGLTRVAKANALPLLDLGEFVALTEHYTKSVTWY